MLVSVASSISAGYLILDKWSNHYVGAHWVVTKELPEKIYESEAHHGPLAQFALIASHHLVELMLFSCIKEVLEASPGKFNKYEKDISDVPFGKALKEWPQNLGYDQFNLGKEPYSSIMRLKDRRNETIHKNSALTSFEMARSALYSAVEGSKAIAIHFRGEKGFKYNKVLEKYYLSPQRWFSEIEFIERRSSKANLK